MEIVKTYPILMRQLYSLRNTNPAKKVVDIAQIGMNIFQNANFCFVINQKKSEIIADDIIINGIPDMSSNRKSRSARID